MIKLFYFFILNHFSIISMNSDLNSEDMLEEYLNSEDMLEEFYVYENVDPKNIKSILKLNQKKSDQNNKKKHVTFDCYLEEQKHVKLQSNSAFCVNSTVLDEMNSDDSTNIVDSSNKKDFFIDLSTDSNVNNEMYFEENIELPLNSQSNEN